MKQSILIAGPTASGKSAFALMLAKKLDGVIINADSMQVYRDLRVLTARPSEAEELEAPHRLYGHLDASESYSAAQWTAQAIVEIRKAQQEGKMPIVIGGTGMYFRFLLEGVAVIPDIDPDIRAAVRAECDAEGAQVLHESLKTLDPAAFDRLHATDSQRVCRAVEVYRSTGKSLSDWHQDHAAGPLNDDDQQGLVDKLVIDIDRETLYDRCNQRFDLMLEGGALAEVEALMKRQLDPQLPCLKSLGYPELSRMISGKMSRSEAADESKMMTRRFAKRQMTYFRNQFKHWDFIKKGDLEKYCSNKMK